MMSTPPNPQLLAIRSQLQAGTYTVDLDRLARRIVSAEPSMTTQPLRLRR